MMIQGDRSYFALAGRLVCLVSHFILNLFLNENIVQEMHSLQTDKCRGPGGRNSV